MWIKQKNADVVVDLGGVAPESHPAIIDHPDLFELVEGEPPEHYDKLNYQAAP